MKLLAIDIGTSCVKAARITNGVVGPVVREPVPNQLAGNRAEISPADLLSSVEHAAGTAVAGSPVDLIAFDTFSSGLIVLSSTGEPRTPIITHADRRSAAEAQELETAVPNILTLTKQNIIRAIPHRWKITGRK
ncbi:MAG: hypothetical protein WCI73_05305, partial [Phycisphaerae bacterium]